MGDFDTSGENTMHQEEGFTSMAPLAVRGPFGMFDALREYSSKARLRYKMNGFNLDLRYITPNIIVMASPADRGMVDPAMRNHVAEVKRFFNTFHKGFVKYYNLVGELGKFVFDTHKLDATIVHDYAFLDHEIPGLARMQSFCNDVKVWLQLDPQNVVVIMCKSGRNRSAVMACSYLLYAWPTEFQTASDAVAYFTWCRMRNGEAINVPSQRRYISYFAQRFAAEPQTLKMSRVFIPVGPLKISKVRLEVHQLRVSGDTKTGDQNEIRLIWTSKGKQLGKIEEGQSYVIFDLPDTLKLQGDVKITFLGRKFSNGPFVFLFSLWFNCGFIDHSPMVWDLSCFDHLSAKWKMVLPDDFHVQTLFVGKPRVACSLTKTKAARIYCWDCEDPFLSEEESILVHRPKTVIGPEGEEMQVQTGPMHRFHPLVEEDCAICKHRHERYEKGLLGDEVMRSFEFMDEAERKNFSSRNAMEYLKSTQDQSIRNEDIESQLRSASKEAFDADQGMALLKNEKKMQQIEKRKEILYFSGQLQHDNIRPPLFGLPTVYCQDTGQFMCAWCNKFALREKDRKKLTRYSIPLVKRRLVQIM